MTTDVYESLRLGLRRVEEVFHAQGPNVYVYEISDLYQKAESLWRQHRSLVAYELWLRANMFRTLVLLREPSDWKSFSEGLILSPYKDGREEVLSKQPAILPLQALHYTNVAVGCCFFKEREALERGKGAAAMALLYYQALHMRSLMRWHAAALMVEARWASCIGWQNEQREYARKAGLLLQESDPSSELYVYARHLAGEGNGLVRKGLFKKHPAYFSLDDLFSFQVLV